MDRIYNYFKGKIKRKESLFYFLLTAILIVNVLDLANYNFKGIIVIINPLHIFFSLVAAFAFYFRKLSFESAFCILIYMAQFNLCFSYLADPSTQRIYSAEFLRSSLFFIMLVSALMLTNNKKHIIISGIGYTVFFSLTLLVRNDFYIQNNAIIFYFAIIMYFGAVYYSVKKIEDQMAVQKELTSKILASNQDLKLKNDTLTDINNILEKQTFQIENQAKELKNLINSRDSFYSIISHDLKNPVGAISGLAELLHDYAINIEDKKVIKLSATIIKSSKYLYELLINLLEWTRLQTGRLTLTPEWFQIREVLEEQWNVLSIMAESKNIKLTFPKVNDRLKIFADRNMIQTVLRNLLSNAIKFTPEGGHVTLKIWEEEKKCLLTVSDTGMGIEQKYLDKLFKIEERFHLPGTNNESGTGLGLLLCKEFIDMHHGTIEVESTVGKGSVFSVRIPLKYETAGAVAWA